MSAGDPRSTSPQGDEPASAREGSALRQLRLAVAKNRFAAVLALLIILFVYFSLSQDRFFSSQNLENLLSGVSVLWIASLGLTFVLLSGGFDLSIGSMLAFGGLLFAVFYNDAQLPAAVALVVTLAACTLIGAGVNGFTIGRMGLSFLVVTLGSMSLLRGVVNIISNSESQIVSSSLIDTIGVRDLAGIPVPIWIMVAAFLVSLYVLKSTYFGRDVYATGGNEEAARVSGIKVSRRLIAVYAISALCAAGASILQVGRLGAASPQVGETLALDAGAAVLLGGTSFYGGIGGVGGTIVGVLFVGVLQNGLGIAGVSTFYQEVVTGVVLILAVFLDKLQRDGWASLGLGSPIPRSLLARRRAGPRRDSG